MFQARRVKVCTYSRQFISAIAAFGLLLSSTIALPAYAEESGSKDTASKESVNKAAWQQLEAMMRHRSTDQGDGSNGRNMHAHWRHQHQLAYSHHRRGQSWAGNNYRHGPQWARDGYRHRSYWAWHNHGRGYGHGGPAWAHYNYRHGRSAWARHDFNRGPWNHYRGGPTQFARWNHHRSHHGDSQFAWRNYRGRDFRGGPPQFAKGDYRHRDFNRGPSQFAWGDQYHGYFGQRNDGFSFGQRDGFAQRDGLGPSGRQFGAAPGPRFADRDVGPPRPRFSPNTGNRDSADISQVEARLDKLDHRIDSLLHEISDMHKQQPQR